MYQVVNLLIAIASVVLIIMGLTGEAQYAVLLLIAYNAYALGRVIYDGQGE